MNKKSMDFKLISIALFISLLISDFLFGSVLSNWIEFCLFIDFLIIFMGGILYII